MMRKSAFVSTLLTVSAATAQAHRFDPPDLNYEYQLHRQFLQRQQIAPAAPTGKSENYPLQKGETLWTLSEMLYGDGQYWPRVWAQNKNITNPHLVKPGHLLHFKMGSEDETPAFRFSEEDDASGIELAASTSGNPIVEIPPPEIPPRPVLKVPASFPEWQSVYKQRGDEFLDDRNLGKTQQKVPDRIFLSGYVQEQPLEPYGFFLENDSESGLPIANQYVYVKMKKGLSRTGQKLLVVKDQGRVKRTTELWDGKDEAYLIQVYAELEVTDMVPPNFKRSSDREKFDVYRALVTGTTGLSSKGDALIPGELQMVNLDKNGSIGTTTAQVIGSERHVKSTMFGPGDLVFLNKGSQHGVEAGHILDIYADRTARRGDTPVSFSPVPSGTIKVVKVSGRLSTAVLLESRETIYQGDQARQGGNANSSLPSTTNEDVDFEDTSSKLDDPEEESSGVEESPVQDNFSDEDELEDEIDAL